MEISEMSYEQYRDQFPTPSEFEHAFGMLTEDEARGLIERSEDDRCIKGIMLNEWHRFHRIAAGETWVTKDMIETFDKSWTLEEYQQIIKICLMDYCSWSEYWDKPASVEQRMKQEENYILWAFKNHETPMSAAVEVGFGCG